MSKAREFTRNFRYKLAYLIAPDWFDDLEYRFSSFLVYATGGRMSKCNYTVQAMIHEAEDFQQRVCEECEYRTREDYNHG